MTMNIRDHEHRRQHPQARNFRLRRAPLVLVVLFLVALACRPAIVSAATAEQLYSETQNDFRALIKEPEKHPERPVWERFIGRFHAVMTNDDAGKFTDKCLFLMAQCYHYLYHFHKNPKDAQEALRHYRLLLRESPHSNLADDAQYMMGIFYLDELHDPQQAYAELLRVRLHFADGDTAPKAAEKLVQLQKQYGYASPTPSVTAPVERQAPQSAPSSSPRQGAASAAPSAPPAGAANVENIDHHSTAAATEVTVSVSGPIAYKYQSVPGSRHNKTPARVILDLKNCTPKPGLPRKISVKDGLLQEIHVTAPAADQVRLIMDVAALEKVTVNAVTNPYRLTVELQRKPTPTVAAQPYPKPKATPAGGPSLAQQLGLGIRRIVLDPGHGGKDTGAISPSGLREKDIVLSIAKKLKVVLERETGCQVLLSRTADRFLSLEERTAFANQRKADIFISIHANAHDNHAVGGVETYFLNLASDQQAARLAALENATSQKKMSDLESILHELVLKSKTSESSRLAREVQSNIVGRLKESYKGVRDLGVKQAPFIVLLGAEMPAVLVETAFLSNEEDELRLVDKSFQEMMGRGIAAGVAAYMQQMKKAGG
jgi:N-acetylmuramoyl-L-alanine amidase